MSAVVSQSVGVGANHRAKHQHSEVFVQVFRNQMHIEFRAVDQGHLFGILGNERFGAVVQGRVGPTFLSTMKGTS